MFEDYGAGVIQINICRGSLGMIMLGDLFPSFVSNSGDPDPIVFEFQLVSGWRDLERIPGRVPGGDLSKHLGEHEASYHQSADQDLHCGSFLLVLGCVAHSSVNDTMPEKDAKM